MPPKPKNKREKAKQKAKEEAVSPKGEVKDSAEMLKEKAGKAYAANEFDRALELYTKAIEIDGTNASLYSNRSLTYLNKKNYANALADAEKCIELKKDWSRGYLRKGIALMALLRYPEAHGAFSEGLKVDANDEQLKTNMAELNALLSELSITEQELSDRKSNPDGDVFDNMVKWLRDGGARFPKLYLKYYDQDYRGVHALAKIPQDDIILYVPQKYIMTSEVAKASDIGRKIIASGVELRSTHSYLAAYLLEQKHKKDSFWRPYLDILPQKYANMPIFFNEDLLAELKNSFTLQKIADRIDSLRREYENIRRAVPEFAKYTQDEFVWARLVVITRIFGLVIGDNKTDGLVPYADMLNHKPPREALAGGKGDECETKWTFDDKLDGFTITTLRGISRGDQIFDSYGRKCNSRFFVNYGFALDENEDNEVMIRVQLPSNDPHFGMKLRMLGGRDHCAKREFQIPANYREKKVRELFSFMRFIHGRDSELMSFSNSEGKLNEIEPLSVRNEIKALEDIRAAATDMYSKFPTTLEDDQKVMSEGIKDFNIRNCYVMRVGEKQVLRWFIDLADRAIPLLQMSWKDLKRVAAKHAQGKANFDHYVTSVVVPLVKKHN